MKRKSLVVFLTMTILIGLFASKTPVFAKDYIVPKSFCVTKNQYQYCFVPYGKVSKIYPIYETQVQHTKGITTTVTVSTDNGRYRVEHVHEIYDATYSSYTLDGASEQVFTKYSLPGYKDSYTRFIQYAN